MGKPYSDDLREPVVAAMERGMSCRAAADLFGIAPSTAGNWHRLYRQRQSVSARPMGGDRRSKLLDYADRFEAWLVGDEHETLWDVKDSLASLGVETSYQAVHRMAHKLGLSFKKKHIRD